MADTTPNFETMAAEYKDYCDRNNLTFQQPSEEHSNMIHGVMYLRTNPVSYVARYDTRRQQFLA